MRGSLEDFRVEYDRDAEKPFDETVVDSITWFADYRDNFVDTVDLVAVYLNDDEAYDIIHGFLEHLLSFQFRPANTIGSYEVSHDNYRFILYETFLYLLATLIRRRKYTAAARFIEAEYTFARSMGGTDYCSEGNRAFYNSIQSLDDHRKQRLGLRMHSVVADFLKQRATKKPLTFHDLYQVDILLFIRPYFPEAGAAGPWYPRCVGYNQTVQTLELFAKATSKRGIKPLQQMLKVTSLSDLADHLDAMFNNPSAMRMFDSHHFFLDVDFSRLFNFDALRHKAAKQG